MQTNRTFVRKPGDSIESRLSEAINHAVSRLLPGEQRDERVLLKDALHEITRLKRASAILDERDRQDEKWGQQFHNLPVWMTILTEEVGELAAAIMGNKFGTDMHREMDWKKEAIQVAAVALAMLESQVEKWEVKK